MPLYEYKCTDCQLEFEELVSSQTQQISCPNCQSQNISKKFSVFAASVVNSANNVSCQRNSCGSGFG